MSIRPAARLNGKHNLKVQKMASKEKQIPSDEAIADLVEAVRDLNRIMKHFSSKLDATKNRKSTSVSASSRDTILDKEELDLLLPKPVIH